MNATASALLWCVVQVTVLAIGAALVYLAARRFHPRAGAAAAGGALAIVLLLTALSASPWPRWDFSLDRHVARGATAAPMPAQAPVPQGNSPAEADRSSNASQRADLDSPQLAFWTALIEGLNNPRPARLADERASPWPLALGLLFATGAILSAVRLVHGMATVRQLARRAHPINEPRLNRIASEMQEKLDLAGPVMLRESNELVTPATVGWRRPIVLLPRTWRSWSDEELHAALAHELAHVASRDYAAWLVARLAVVAHFYHPLVRWLATRLQLEQELAADLTAASLIGDRKQYLHSLAALALATPPHRVAGPVRTLIPTRSLLVRRVEMLRTSGMHRPRRPVIRYATFTVVALVGIVAAGLRGPGVESGNVALAQTPTAQNEATASVERISLELVPQDATFVVSVRPAEIVARDELHAVRDFLDEMVRPLKDSGLSVRDVREVIFITSGQLDDARRRRIVIRFVDPRNKQQFLEAGQRLHGVKKARGQGVWQAGSEAIVELDGSTLAFGHPGIIASLKNAPPRWAKAWHERKDQPVVGAVNVANLREKTELDRRNLAGGLPLQMVAPVIEHADWAVAALALEDHLRLFGTLQCDSEESAKDANATLQALAVLLQNVTRNQMTAMERMPVADVKTAKQIALAREISEEAGRMLAGAEFKVDGQRVGLTLQSQLSTADIATLVKSALPTIEEARQAARQTIGMNNLKQLALAMLVYEGANRVFPLAANHTYRKNGQVLKSEHPHSWRVAILPYLEQQALYEQYRFGEPWDSEANKKVLAQMPDVFRSPFDDPQSTNTSYFVLTGPGTIFDGDKGARFTQITDGTSRTLLLVESKRPVPWTKPEDIPYAADQPVPELGGWVPGEFVAARADGSVQRASTDVDEATLRGWITKAGGEPVAELPTPDGDR